MFPFIGLLLLLTVCALPYGNSEKRVSDSAWAEGAIVTSLSSYEVSNYGNAAIQANVTGQGCPTGSLYLAFINATAAGNVLVPGEMDSRCKTVAFLTRLADDFPSIRPGVYGTQIRLGQAQRLVALAMNVPAKANNSGSSNSSSSNGVPSNTIFITVVQAATAHFVRQFSNASRTRATVTLSVALDEPFPLPTSVALRVWDSTAVEVEPASLAWGPGESDSKDFTLRLTRAAPSGQAAPWAELVPGENMMFPDGVPPRMELKAPRPAFYTIPNQVFYRSVSSGSASSGGSSSSGGGGGNNWNGSSSRIGGAAGGGGAVTLSVLGSPLLLQSKVGSVAVTVQRASPSPFGSTLYYRTILLQAAGCTASECPSAVSGSGLLRIPSELSSACANVSVNWAALAPEAALAIGLQLTAIDNADLLPLPNNTISLYVYGSVYGTCPAGTIGPWQVRRSDGGVQLSEQTSGPSTAAPSPSRAAGTGAPTSLVAASPPPPWSLPRLPPRTLCNASAMLGALLDLDPASAMLPVLSACAGGDALRVLPSVASAPRANTSEDSSSEPQPSAQNPTSSAAPTAPETSSTSSAGGGDAVATPVELLVPYGQDAVSVFIPLGDADETVVMLNTTCRPTPRLAQAAAWPRAASTTGGGEAVAWAELELPTSLEMCYALLQVYGSMWSGQDPQPGQGRQQQPPAGGSGGGGAAAPPSVNGGQGAPRPPVNATSNTTRSRALLEDPSSTSGTSPNSVSRSPAAEAVSPAPPPPSAASPGGVRLPILSMVRLRTFNVTLRPRSNPDLFSAGALSLYLLHRPSGSCLPLCGLPLPVLRAAAVQLFGDDVDPGSQVQLDTTARTLVQAIRGGADASAQLHSASGAIGGDGSRGAEVGHRRVLSGVGQALQRWLTALLPGSGHGSKVSCSGMGGLAKAAARGRSGAEAGVAREGVRVGARRRVLQLTTTSSSRSSPAATQPPPPSPPTSSAAPARAAASLQLQSEQPAPSTGPSPSTEPQTSSGPGALLAAGAQPEGFELPGALDQGDGCLRVMSNPQFADWCHSWEEQVVDLALLTMPYDMALVASSLGLELQLAAADDSSGQLGQQQGPAEVRLGPAVHSELLRRQGQVDTVEGLSGGAGVTGGAGKCLAQAPRPEADQRLTVQLVAPDGVSTAPVRLALFVDYRAAKAAAAAAAMACQQSRDSDNTTASTNTSNNTYTGTGISALAETSSLSSLVSPARAPALAPDSPQPVLVSLPGPLPLWSSCQPCGPGTFSDTANATVCQLCAPGAANNGTCNKDCLVCAPGTFASQAGSTSCRPCYAGSFARRPGSTECTVCPAGTTSLADGARECVVPPQPAPGNTALVVSFQMVLNVSTTANNKSVAQAASAGGMASNASADSVFKMLIAADTAAALRIPPTQVRVSLMLVSPSSFLVNVSATMPLGQATSTGAAASPPGTASPSDGRGGSGSGPALATPEVDADTLISRLVDNPDGSFPRTREASGGSLQVQYVQRQVVVLDGDDEGVNLHVVLWPILGGTLLLALLLGVACRGYWRRRRAPLGALALPPITDALGRLCTWKVPTSPPATIHFAYGRFVSLELQEQQLAPAGSSTASARQRAGRSGSKANLPALGMTLSSDSADMLPTSSPALTADLDAMTLMYTRDALAAPRI